MHSGIGSTVDGLGRIMLHPVVVAAITLVLIVCVIQAFRKNKVRMSNRQMSREAEDAHIYREFKKAIKWVLIFILFLVGLGWWMLSGSSPETQPFIYSLF